MIYINFHVIKVEKRKKEKKLRKNVFDEFNCDFFYPFE
jgi:hypothetical protein